MTLKVLAQSGESLLTKANVVNSINGKKLSSEMTTMLEVETF